MRKLTRNDIILFQNIQKMLKSCQFRSMDYEEALAVGQVDAFLRGLIVEINKDIQIEYALANAKEITPEKTESLKDQAPIVEQKEQPKAKGKK